MLFVDIFGNTYPGFLNSTAMIFDIIIILNNFIKTKNIFK